MNSDPEMIAELLDKAVRLIPVSTPLLALIGACGAAVAMVLHAYSAYRHSKMRAGVLQEVKAAAFDAGIRLPPPEQKK